MVENFEIQLFTRVYLFSSVIFSVCDAKDNVKEPKAAATVADKSDKCQHKARNSTLIKVN